MDSSPRFAATRNILTRLLVVATALTIATIAAAGDPATKVLLGPADPAPAPRDSWVVMGDSFEQFLHYEYILRMLLSLTLAVACGWVVARHPRRTSRLDPLSDLEERKALILLGVVGAVIAELSSTSQTLAFVIFGIGALLRFRTLLNNAKITGKAIMVVVIGLACGMGQWAMAVFVTLYAWALVFWLDSHMSCRIRIRVKTKADIHALYIQVQEVLRMHHARVKNSTLYDAKRQMVFLLQIPAALDPDDLESDLRAKIPPGYDATVDVRVD